MSESTGSIVFSDGRRCGACGCIASTITAMGTCIRDLRENPRMLRSKHMSLQILDTIISIDLIDLIT